MNTQTIENSGELPLVTFNSLYSLLREEKKTKVLQKLPENFYPGLKKFLEDKHQEIIKHTTNRESTKALKEQKVIVSSENLSRELLNLRLIKISTIAVKTAVFSDEDFTNKNILSDEEKYFEEALKLAQKTSKLI